MSGPPLNLPDFATDAADRPPPLVTQLAQSLLRSWLNAIAGLVVGKGILTADQGDQLVTIGIGLGLWAVSYAWSAWQKGDAQRRLKAAIAAPAGKAAP